MTHIQSWLLTGNSNYLSSYVTESRMIMGHYAGLACACARISLLKFVLAARRQRFVFSTRMSTPRLSDNHARFG